MKHIFTLLTFILFNHLLLAQVRLEIFTSEEISRQALSSVTIKISRDGQVFTKLQSNDRGKIDVEIPSEGTYLLQASFIGYRNLDTLVKVNATEMHLNLFLAPNLSELNTVTVTASKPYLQMKRGNLILNVDQSPLMNSGSMWEMLRYVPSVQVNESGSIAVKSQSTTVFLDGRRIYLTGIELKDYLQSIPSINVAQVEVIANPSGIYPADVQTVINIKTKGIEHEGIKGMVSNSLTQATFLRDNFSTRFDIKKSAFDGQFGYSLERGKQRDLKDISTMQRENQFWDVYQRSDRDVTNNRFYSNLGFKPDTNSQISLYVEFNPNRNNSYTYSDNGQPTFERLQMGDSIFNFQSNARTKANGLFAQATYQLSWDSTRQNLKAQLEYFYNKRSFSNHREINSFTLNENGQKSLFLDVLPQNLRTVVALANYSRELFGGELVLGVRFFRNMLHNDNQIFSSTETLPDFNLIANSKFSYSEHTYSSFAEWGKDIGEFYYRFGLRLENTRISATNLSSQLENKINWLNIFPSLLVQWTVNEHNVWNLSYKNTFTRPDYYQLNPFERFTDNSVANFRGNQGIRPQRDHTLDLSWTDNDIFTTSIGAQYLKDFISTIVLADEKNNLFQQYDNFNAYVYYANLNATVDLQKWWKVIGSSNLAYYDVKYDKVQREQATPLIDLRLVNAFFMKKKWIAQISAYYTKTMSDGFFKHFAYSNISLALQKRFERPNLTLTASFTDIFRGEIDADRTLYQHMFYRSSTYNDSRSVRLSLLWNFGKQKIKVIDKVDSESKEAIERLK